MEIFAISDLMCRLYSQIKIFEANKKDGIMSRNKIFYDENFTQDDINEIFKETRIKLGEKHGFNGLRMIQASQKTETNNVKYTDGKYINIKEYQRIDGSLIFFFCYFVSNTVRFIFATKNQNK